MTMSTSSEMLSQLEELQFLEHKESTLPKTLSEDEIADLLEAIDLYFLFNYDSDSFFSKKLEEIKLFLDLRSEVLSRYATATKAD
jgi:thiamine kinase-like enzyme